MRAALIGLLGFCPTLCGCATDLRVTPIAPGYTGRVMGMGYTLPFTQYAITTKWTVTSCDPALEVTAVVDATVGSAEDQLHAYSIDPQSLQTLASVASLKITYQEKTNLIDTINASAEDQSATAIVNVVTGAAKLALAVLAPVPNPHGNTVTRTIPTCSGETKDQLEAKDTLVDHLNVLNGRVDEATGAVAKLAAKVLAMGSAVDEETKVALSRAIDNLNDLTGQQTRLAKALAEAQKPLTYSVMTYWPPDSVTFSASPPLSLPPTVVGSWTGQKNNPLPLEGDRVYFAIERIGTFGRDPAKLGLPAEPDASLKGVRYWMPAQGRLLVCKAQPCASNNIEAILAKVDGRISQLGYIGVLPVHTKPFGSTSFTASFDAAGGLKTAGYEQKAAPAVVASGAFASAADQVAPVLTAFSPAARLKRETEALETAKKQRDALVALQADPNQAKRDAAVALDADTALLQAEISNRQASATLDALAAAQPH